MREIPSRAQIAMAEQAAVKGAASSAGDADWTWARGVRSMRAQSSTMGQMPPSSDTDSSSSEDDDRDAEEFHSAVQLRVRPQEGGACAWRLCGDSAEEGVAAQAGSSLRLDGPEDATERREVERERGFAVANRAAPQPGQPEPESLCLQLRVRAVSSSAVASRVLVI